MRFVLAAQAGSVEVCTARLVVRSRFVGGGRSRRHGTVMCGA
jgi:hypothetical protein